MADEGHEYICEYPFGREGARWGLTIWAKDEAEAAERLKAIGAWGVVNGKLYMRIPATVPSAGLLARFIAWWLNRRAKLTGD